MQYDHILVGRTLTGIQLASDKKAIRFKTTEGDVIAQADGDCCSDTWIESIEMPARGFPAVVSAAEPIAMPDQVSEDEYSELACYGFRLTTDAGHIIIDYRNMSNGYYGGNLSWPGDYFYGGVYGQNVSTQEWGPTDGQ